MMDEKVIEVAVNWWAEKFNSNGHIETGDAFLNMSLVVTRATQPEIAVSEDAIDAFKMALRNELLNPHPDDFRMGKIVLNVDYEAKGALKRALDAVGLFGVAQRQFPIKTVMWVEPTGIGVREGYGADIRTLYAINLHR